MPEYFYIFGLRVSIYICFHVLGFLCAGAYVLVFAPKFGFKRIRSLILTVICYFTVYGIMMLIYWIVTGELGGQNIVRVFVLLPFIIMMFAEIFGMDIKKSFDFLAPVPCIVHGVSHIGCIFPGCCRANFSCSWGIMNNFTETRLFPVQLFESATALAIAFILIWISAKSGWDNGGRLMPWMLISFGVTRFFWEFIRNNLKLFWGISELAIWALAAAVVGMIMLIVMKKRCKPDLPAAGSERG